MTIENKTFDEERALYALNNASVHSCSFEGPADGESAFKEASDIDVSDCRFMLRYPFWHTRRFSVESSSFGSTARAALWYAIDGKISNCELGGVKCLRECDRIAISQSKIVSPEFGWRCRDITMEDCSAEGEYFLFESKNLTLRRFTLKGKYSFQYTENVTVEDSLLDTKDAFWHSHGATVKNCRINGEYLGWYSDGLTLINCTLAGTQPLCYCKNLRLVNCKTENADLAFEYSQVDADIIGNVESVKNPASGIIVADSYGDIVLGNSVMPLECRIETRRA